MATAVTPSTTRHRVPSYAVVLSTVVALTTVIMALNLVAAIVVGVVDEGPRSLEHQLAGVLGFGTLALVVSLAGAALLARTPERSRLGAIAFATLAVPGLLFFFSGLPGMLGATAAHLSGLTRGRTPLPGPARVFGLVGLVIALLNVLVCVVGVSVAWLTELG